MDSNVSLDLIGPSRHHFVIEGEVDLESARKSMGRALSRRQNQYDLVRFGFVLCRCPSAGGVTADVCW